MTIINPVVGDVYQVTVYGTAVAYTAVAGDTDATIAGALAGKILAAAIPNTTVSYSGGALFKVTGNPNGAPTNISTAGSTVPGDLTAATTTAPQTASAGDASYDATGFTTLIVGSAPDGGFALGPNANHDVSFINVAKGDTITIDHATGGVVNVVGAAGTTETLNIGVDGSPATATAAATGTGSQFQGVFINSASTLTVGSYGVVKDAAGVAQTNTLGIGDTALATLTITGDQNLSVFTSSTNVTSIDASAATGDVTVIGAILKGGPVAHTITGGKSSGVLTVQDGNNQAGVDTITAGAGGLKLDLSGTGGGSWTGATYGTGSVTVNLSASAKAVDTLTVHDGALVASNGSTGGVAGFVTGVSNADVVSFANPKTVMVNTSVTAVTDALNVNALLKASGTVLTNLDYSVSNGVITFTATGGAHLSDFATADLVKAAEIVVDNYAANTIAAVSIGGSAYVISDLSNVANNVAVLGTSVIDLNGVSSVAGFGQTGAVNTIGTDGISVIYNNAGVANSGTASAAVYAEVGYAADSIAVFGTTSTSISNLAASAVLTLNDGGGAVAPVTISQTGGAGNTSLTLNLAAADTFNSITVNGDATLTINPIGNAAIHSLVDSANTLTTITVAGGGGTLDIGGITDTALKTVDAHNATAAFTLGDLTPIANAGLTVDLAVAHASTISVSGAGDTIVDGSATGTFGNGVVDVTANGLGDTITVSSSGAGNHVVANGGNDTIDLGNNGAAGGYAVTALGSGDTIVFTATHNTASVVAVGSSASVTFGAGNEAVVTTGDLTGATSGGSYAVTTLNHVVAGANETITFNNATNENWAHFTNAGSQVNVASVTTLSGALDLAASQAALSANPNPGAAAYATLAANTGAIDWFQFHGDTYVVEAINSTGANAAHTALTATDEVVKITGLVDLSHSNFVGHTLTV